jgi:hypothetical protein
VIFMISFGACVPVEPWYPAPINEHRSLGKGGTGWGGGGGGVGVGVTMWITMTTHSALVRT